MIIKSDAAIVVALDSTVAVPRGPKTVCEPIPPNAPAKVGRFTALQQYNYDQKKTN